MVCNTPVITIEDLKTRIRKACKEIRPGALREVWDNMKLRLNVLQNMQGGHIEILEA